ncbi:MAG: PorP/SprF family type IX secretion system membrane protein, partial [Bacteroidota bacterium]
MKKTLLFISFFLCSIQLFYSQENGVVSFALPIRNSLKFNRYLINPAFSFVREQGSYISFYNKRQWTEFDNAPQTYLFGYSGRFKENEGIAIGLFQQNYGVLTTFGVVTNFAHNVVLDTDSNLTFGLNLGLYKSGLNNGKVITNYSDPSLNNIPSNLLASINPGINYGTAFLDFGLSVNNLILYNLKTSELIKENPERSIELHMMHTGYLDTYGFLDKSKFSALLKTELKKDKTVISGLMMFNVPNGIWAQAGYNTLYGMSAGLGLNITPRISIEYNFEKATGNLSNFGASHEITLAYKFKRDNYYNDDDDNEGALITPKVTKKYVASKPKTNENTKTVTDNRAKLVADAKIKAEEKAKLAADAKAKIIENRAKLVAENNAKREAIVQNKPTTTTQNTTTNKIQDTKANAQVKLLANEREKTKLTAEEKTKKIADANAKLIADIQIKAEQKAKIVADNRAKVIADRAKLIADAKAKREAMVLARLSAKNKTNNQVDNTKLVSNTDAKTKADAAAQAKLLADAKLKAETDAKAKIDAAARAILLAEAKLKTETDAKAKADAAAQAKLLTDAKLKTETDAKAKADAAAQAKLLAEAKLKPETDAKAKADAAAQAKLLADAKLKAETDA